MASVLLSNAVVSAAAFAADSDWDNSQGASAPHHVHLSDQARKAVDQQSPQPFQDIGKAPPQTLPEDDWDADRKSRVQQGHSSASQADQAPLHKPRSAPLEGGIVSSTDNLGPAQNLREIRAQEAHMFSLFAGAPPPFPDPKMVSPSLYKNWLKETHADLPVTDKNAIVEIKGQWDDSGHILHYFGWLFTKVGANAAAKFDFSHTSVAIVDCAGNLNEDAIEALRSFVFDGGYVVSTDWALDNFIVRAFPGVIEWNGGYSYPDLVDAIIVDLHSELIKNCVPSARWKLDDKCQTVKIRRPEHVHVLVRSPMLSRQDPDGRGILAASFQYGRGQVLHVVGHFDINSAGTFTNSLPDPAPRIGIGLRQAIIANFIAAGIQAHRGADGKTRVNPESGADSDSDSDSKMDGKNDFSKMDR